MKISILVLFCLIVIWMGWRIASRYQSIPCPAWLSWLVEKDNPFSKINRASTIIANSDIREGMVVLDAGCGPGRIAIPAARAVGTGGKLVALDIQNDMLKKVQKKAESEKLKNIEWIHAGLGNGILNRNQFDRVLLVTVLGEIPNQKAALQELFDALKPHGILSVTEIIFDPHYQSRNAVIEAASSVGFQEKERFEDWAAFTILFEKPCLQKTKASGPVGNGCL